jgi:hypothetical protein
VTEDAFEVLDALGGFASLAKRSPTLDGAVPVRVAQGCVPLLEGNALGFQVVFEPGLIARRKLGRSTVEVDRKLRERLERAIAATIPRLTAQGFLRGGAWAKRFEAGVAWTERGTVRVWTGLLVRPRRGVWLRVSGTANRRNAAIDVAEAFVADDEPFVPLVVDLDVRTDHVRLEGEIACVVPLQPGARVKTTTLEEEPALGRAHAEFYDRAYFATKAGRVTRKYRRLVAGESRGGADVGEVCVARVGPGRSTIGRAARFLVAGETALRPRDADADDRALEHVTFANPVALAFSYDGHTMTVEPDARSLASAAQAVERAWEGAFGAGAIERDRRALWYLTKYVTLHPPGDPHFFVKPFAFVQTPPGWSSVVEGVHGDGYDVLRGVVSTDVFHATPAVFHVRRSLSTLRLAEGASLVRVTPVPRCLLAATWRPASFLDAFERSSA